MEKWKWLVQNAVDEQEHSFKPCNVVDLEKRLRKQKTSDQGRSETISITNPDTLKKIERWRKAHHRAKYNMNPTKSNPRPSFHASAAPCVQPTVRSHRSQTLGVIKKKEKKLLTTMDMFGMRTSEDDDDRRKKSASNESDSKDKVRVMRDEEVLQLDEEIPLENFMRALDSGFVKIRSDTEQNEQYKKATETARDLVKACTGNYRRFVTDDFESDSDSDWDASESGSDDESSSNNVSNNNEWAE